MIERKGNGVRRRRERVREGEKKEEKVRFINSWNVFRQCELRKKNVYLGTKSINNILKLSKTVTVISPCLSDCTYKQTKKAFKQTKITNTHTKKQQLYCETFRKLLAIALVDCCPNIYSSAYLRSSRMSSKEQTTLDLH